MMTFKLFIYRKIEEKMKQIGEMEERAEKTLEKLSTRFTKNKEDKSSFKKLTLSQIKEQLDLSLIHI